MKSKQQSAIMDLLKDFKCLRVIHIERYMRIHFDSTEKQVRPMLSQLRHMGDVMLNGELVMLPHRPVNHDVLAAFDIMFEVTAENKAILFPGKPPCSLYFTVDGVNNSRFYGIIVVKLGGEHELAINIINNRSPDITLILILQDIDQNQYFGAVKNAFFVLRDGGKYRYFNNS